MKIWKVILAVLLIFGAGVVTGGMLVRTRVVTARPAMAMPGGPPGPGLWGQPRQQFVLRLNRQLDLTAGQTAEVDRILRGSHERMSRLWDPIAPQAREETRKVRDQIQSLLTPDQKTKFNRAFKPARLREPDDRKDRRPPRDRDTNASSRVDGKSNP